MPEDQGRRRPRGPLGYLIVGFLAAAMGVLLGVQYFRSKTGQGPSDQRAKVESGKNGGEAGVSQLRRTSESFRSIAKRVGPAVVNIKSTKGMPKGRGASRGGRRFHGQAPPDEDEPGPFSDPFYDFFQRFGGQMPFQQELPQTSLGSGILIDKKGIIVTNNHVVEDATEITVNLSNDSTEIKAKVIGTDPKTDLAVIKLATSGDYPTAEWADSDAVEVGDWAIAIGSPFALGNSVTLGIVSAKGRNAQGLTGAEYGGDLLQTDAAINPGNSGGPLCDLDGRVMGVNTAIYTRSGGYMGIGFAIPSNLAKDVVGKLIKDGRIIRGWLGVYIQPLDPDLGRELGVKEGVSIHEVVENSPAAAAGLTAGDVVVEVDGQPVKEINQLQHTISNYKPGQKVRVKVVTYVDKKTKTVTVTIGTLPEKEAEARPTSDEEPDKLGLIVSPARGGAGVVVDQIQPGSLADQQLGLEVGDILVRINRKPVDSVATYKKLISTKQLALEVKRKGRTLFFRFSVPE